MRHKRFTPSPDIAAGCAATVSRLRVQAGGIKVLAHHMGCSTTQAARFADSSAPDHPCLAQLAAATAATRASAAAEFLAELAGGRFVPGAGEAQADLVAAMRSTIGEATEVIYRVVEATADGVITAAEWAAVERSWADLVEAGAAMLKAGRHRAK